MRRGLRVVVLLAALSPACGKSERLPFEPAFKFDPAARQNLVPFPIDLMTRGDSTSRTGIRLNIQVGFNRDLDRMLTASDTVMGLKSIPLITSVFRTLSFKEIQNQLNTLDGFGLLTPVFIPLSAAVDLKTLPSLEKSNSLDSSIYLVDTTSFSPGSAFELEKNLTAFKAGWEVSGYQVSLISLFPLEPQHRYAVVLRPTLKDADGRKLSRPGDYSKLVSGAIQTSGDAAAYMARVAAFHKEVLAPAKLDEALAFEFTTMSGADDVVNAVQVLSRNPSVPPMEGLQAVSDGTLENGDFREIANDITGGADLIRGVFKSIDFRGVDELMPLRIEATDAPPNRTLDIEFLLSIPKSVKPAGGYPISILQHGLGNMKLNETKWRKFASRVTEQGVAVIAIDAIKHSFRAAEEYREVHGLFDWHLDLIDFANPLRTRDSIRQNFLDLWQLSNRVIPALNDLNLPTCGKSCFDLNRKGYAGESLGGILGSGFTSIDTSIKTTVLYVGGGELTQLVRGEADNRFLFLLGVANNCPPEVLLAGLKSAAKCLPENPLVFEFSDSPAAESLFYASAQTLIDKCDPAVYAPGKYRRPFFPGSDSNSLLLIESSRELTVTNISTERLAIAFGVPNLGAPLTPQFFHTVPGMADPPAGLSFPVSGNLTSTGASYGFVQVADPKAGEGHTAHTYPLESDGTAEYSGVDGNGLGVKFLTTGLKNGRAEVSPNK